MIIDKKTAISIGALTALLPLGTWVMDCHSELKVMASEINELKTERAYIRTKLDEIYDKISKVALMACHAKNHERKEKL